MSLSRGMKALNLEPTDKVPRLEHSAHMHWELVRTVTGLPVETKEERIKASSKFIQEWDYDMFWYAYFIRDTISGKSISNFPAQGGGNAFFRKNPHARITSMGHAVYSDDAEGKTDFNNKVYCPFKDIDDALNLDPVEEYGEFDKNELTFEAENVFRELKEFMPDLIVPGGVYISLFSGLIEIFGWEMLLMLIAQGKCFERVIEKYYLWVKQFFDAYAAADIEVIISHDDLVWSSGPPANPEWFRKYLFPRLKKLWEPLHNAGKKIIFTCDGDMTEFLKDNLDHGAHMIVSEPMSNFRHLSEKYGDRIAFAGSMDTRILLSGNKDEIFNEVEKQLSLFKKYPGFFMSVGNCIPANTPISSALWYNEAYCKLAKR